jgi:hypothetical protein
MSQRGSNDSPRLKLNDDGKNGSSPQQIRLITRRNAKVKLVEPPSCNSASTIIFIGKNRRGNWIAQEQNGLYGGLFVSRAEAFKYALFENAHHPETIVELSREIELDMNGAPRASDRELKAYAGRAA